MCFSADIGKLAVCGKAAYKIYKNRVNVGVSRQPIKRVADTQSEPKTEPLYSRLRDLKPNKKKKKKTKINKTKKKPSNKSYENRSQRHLAVVANIERSCISLFLSFSFSLGSLLYAVQFVEIMKFIWHTVRVLKKSTHYALALTCFYNDLRCG